MKTPDWTYFYYVSYKPHCVYAICINTRFLKKYITVFAEVMTSNQLFFSSLKNQFYIMSVCAFTFCQNFEKCFESVCKQYLCLIAIMFTSCQVQGAFISCRLIGQTLGQIYISIQYYFLLYWCQKCNVKNLGAKFIFVFTVCVDIIKLDSLANELE